MSAKYEYEYEDRYGWLIDMSDDEPETIEGDWDAMAEVAALDKLLKERGI